ncbi:hypothetical protein ABL78_8315 [Leptomonas seymouri]|uniref:Uncharacterized protein n=1 Tax=Leptomonas seymouri TaxID=5684 RepID=A0A0N1I0R6_LEPSE|nr:hypothetical protein ABL78_8315 [Leptomonas seymouri]|eukprot:KPI82672.1 hypothetical protein ABL78_8315 [Leptomonas seymouri]
MADLLRQDTYFTGYSLNVLVSIGLAMEETQPTLARGVYTLANKRAVEVFGYPNRVLVKCLAATSSGNPHLREELFEDTGKDSSGRDITFFPRRFFESVRATWVRVRDTRGTDGFYRLLPPNYAVALFQT